MTAVELTPEQEVRERLRWDSVLFAENCCHIVTKKGGKPVLIEAKPEQVRFDDALEAQRAAGLPMRAIILKARQIGFSTWTQAKLIQRVTQNPYHAALVLAQLNDTSQKLFEIGYRMWQGIPDEADLKPKKMGGRKSRLLELDNHSTYQSASAKEFEGGRGLTLHSVHVSEPAFYPDAERKLTGLLEAVPDEPDTLIVLESTPYGANYFKELWDAAEAGNDYIPFFSPWFRESTYRLRFANQAEYELFCESLGDGTVGEDEPDLISLMGDEGYDLPEVHEALNWRRRKIRSFKGDVDKFHQEYASTPKEAFLTTGRYVFSVALRQKAEKAVEPPAATGFFEATGLRLKRSRGMVVEVPTGVKFTEGVIDDDRRPGWRVWEHPVAATETTGAAQYIIGLDASGGDETDDQGTTAYHAIEVIDHKTRRQVAEYRSQIDPDLLAFEAYLACLYFNRPWIAPEITGSWGAPVARRLDKDFGYPFVYKRARNLRKAGPGEESDDSLGWDTNKVSKSILVAGATELLRDDLHGVRSKGLADEIGWYVRDQRGRMKPEGRKWADRLMSWMIAQQVAAEKPVRPDRKRGEVSTTLQGARVNQKTGYLR
jgi:hypothetical protein